MRFSLLNIQNPTLIYPGGSKIDKNGPKGGPFLEEDADEGEDEEDQAED